jgi:hypothetical protein
MIECDPDAATLKTKPACNQADTGDSKAVSIGSPQERQEQNVQRVKEQLKRKVYARLQENNSQKKCCTGSMHM